MKASPKNVIFTINCLGPYKFFVDISIFFVYPAGGEGEGKGTFEAPARDGGGSRTATRYENPKSPKIEKNLKVQSRLKFSISTFRTPHKKMWRVARLKFTISLDNQGELKVTDLR